MVDIKNLIKFMSALFVAMLTVLVISGTAVLAAQTNLPNGFVIKDSDGTYVGIDGKYLIYADHIMPGDVITKTITIFNLKGGKIPFKLSMMAEQGLVSGPVSLLDTITLTVMMDDEALYHGRLRGDEGNNMIQNALYLGTYAQGDSKTLHIRIEVGSFDPNAGTSVAEISWIFYAAKGSNIGDCTLCVMYALAVLIILAVIMLLLLGKRMKQKENNT